MPASTSLPVDPLIRVARVRQEWLPRRIAFALCAGTVSAPMANWRHTLCWFAVYALYQLLDGMVTSRRLASGSFSMLQTCVALAIIFGGNVIFGSLGLLLVFSGGPWGLTGACMLWSGSFVHTATGYSASNKAMIASWLPQAGFLLSIPFLVVHSGGPLIYGLLIVLAGILHGLSTVEVWSIAKGNYEAERRESAAAQAARHDPETGLPNRLAFEEALAAAETGDARPLVVAVLEIDRFADLRSAIGYSLVARLIREVTIRLASIHGSLVGHLSEATLGVTFHAESLTEARAYAVGLRSAMAKPIVVDGIDVDVALTVGLAVQGSGDGTGVLLERAGIALGAARKAAIGIAVFDPDRAPDSAGNLSLMSDMLRSIEKGEITNHYQPKYDLRSGELAAVEALVRWQHPERGAIAPDAFIPLAEETGRIRELTIDVMSRAVRDQAWLAERGHRLPFAVNLSGRLLDDPDVIQQIIDIAGPAAARISMEVTETAMMAHPETALMLLHKLRAAGIGVAIDDYGSGLSSLAYLKNIPADELKIDKSFVSQMDRDRQDCLLVRSTIALAHSFGLRVVAEGVESSRTLEILGQMNCDQAQGYHMARPMPVARLAELLESGGAGLTGGYFAAAAGGGGVKG